MLLAAIDSAVWLPLFVLVAAAAGLLALARRMQRPPAGTRAVPLSAQHAVHVVEIDGRRFLLGTGPAAAPALLAELAPHEPQAPALRVAASDRKP